MLNVILNRDGGVLTSISMLSDPLNPIYAAHAPVEHEEQEVIGELAAKEKTLREAREKIDLGADDEDLKNLLNPKPKKKAPADDASSGDGDDTKEDADDSGDDEDGGDDMGDDDLDV